MTRAEKEFEAYLQGEHGTKEELHAYLAGWKRRGELDAQAAREYSMTRSEAEDGQGGNAIADEICKLDEWPGRQKG